MQKDGKGIRKVGRKKNKNKKKNTPARVALALRTQRRGIKNTAMEWQGSDGEIDERDAGVGQVVNGRSAGIGEVVANRVSDAETAIVHAELGGTQRPPRARRDCGTGDESRASSRRG